VDHCQSHGRIDYFGFRLNSKKKKKKIYQGKKSFSKQLPILSAPFPPYKAQDAVWLRGSKLYGTGEKRHN
jgi:hypothetical protein